MDKPSRSFLTAEAARAFQTLCAFCSWALLDDLDEERLRQMAGQRELLLDPPFSQVAPEASREFVAWLEEVADSARSQDALAALKRDRTFLFYMTGASRTSPFESVYRTDDATMFGPTTLEVREAYRAHGLRFERAATEPDDHVGLEFAFAAALLDEVAGTLEQGGDASVAEGDLKTFLSGHLLVFAPLYLDNVRTQARTACYRAAVDIGAATLETLAEALDAAPVEKIDVERFSIRR